MDEAEQRETVCPLLHCDKLVLGQGHQFPGLGLRGLAHQQVPEIPDDILNKLGEILARRHDIVDDLELCGDIAVQQRITERVELLPVHKAQHLEDVLKRDLLAAIRDQLLENTLSVADSPVRGACDGQQHFIGARHLLLVKDAPEQRADIVLAHAAEIVALAARDDRGRHLMRFRRRQDEYRMGGRLFEGLEQRIEGGTAQLMHFVDHVDLIPRR